MKTWKNLERRASTPKWSCLLLFFLCGFLPLSANTVDSFTLMNADTDLPIAGYDPSLDSTTLNLATLPTQNLNVRANTTPADNGSIQFQLNGNTNYRTENSPPYALEGDSVGDYYAWTPSVGANTLTATAYDANNIGGTTGASLTINFTVVVQSANQYPIVSITDPPELRITEIMYHPLDPSPFEVLACFTDPDDFEYLEITNVGTTAIELLSIRFTDGIDDTFSDVKVFSGESVLLASHISAFEQRYDTSLPVLGAYTGNLRNSGETLRLASALDQTIHEFRYDNG